MTRAVTAKPGRYSMELTPYQKEPQESFTDSEVQTTVLYWAKRLGKTEMVNNLHGATIEQTPRNILHCMPTLDSAKKWSKQFFMPMIRSCVALRNLIKDSRQKDANNTILSKEFPGGTISAIGANSPSGFRQVQAPVVTCDEIDAMEDGPEGDPVSLAFGRAENYPDSIQVVCSTATIKSTSRIESWWQKSDQRKWFVPCGCGSWHVLAFENLKCPGMPDKYEDVANVAAEKFESERAWYECPACGAKWDDYTRVKAICAGEWRPTAPFRGIRGYWLNGLNSTFAPKKGYKNKLHQFAAEFYEAFTLNEAARTVWKNTFLCVAIEEIAEKFEVAPLLERVETYTQDALPVEIALVACAVDVQGDRLEYEIIGLGDGEETWGIEYGKLPGNPEKSEVWESLKGILSRTFTRKDGVVLKITCTAIDHRYKGSRVRNFVKTCGLGRVYPVYGSAGKQSLLVLPHHNKHYRMVLYSVNTDAAKDTLFARLKLKEHGARYMHFPAGYGYEAENKYFEGLTAEEVRIKYNKGFAERYYWKDANRRNEPIDLRVYFLAAMDILKPSIKHIAAALLVGQPESVKKDYELRKTPQKTSEATQAPSQNNPRQTAQVSRRPRIKIGGGSFAGAGSGWRV